MSLIEVVPNSTSISAPGWAYVPDNGYDPSKIAIQPSGARKRAARTSGVAGGDTTTRQQSAILRHLAELDKDSSRDVQIPVPHKLNDGESKATRNKLTPNVRRILTSQKTFANHLADEEAALALQDQTPTVPSLATPRPSSSKTTPLQKRSSTSQLPTESAIIPQADETNQADIEMGGVDTGSTENIQINPLLKSYIPSAPSKAVMEALLLGPPLSYNAARAAPSSGKPQRRFCEMCGYWGTIKCLKCGARVCGLECRKQHGDGRCLFYA